jgi:demethylmenaquinone methyltransferase/2-methoxy-6-polyprenyl-1,4-benzoquinol methylase
MKLEDWKRVIDTLESMIPYYERMNLIVTFFMLWRWRKTAAGFARPNEEVLELGSGPGEFSRRLDSRRIWCMDPSEKMLHHSRRTLEDERYNLVMGIGENIPVKDDYFDKVFCLFSLRDFIDRSEGAAEICRVLRKGGMIVIIDILKPSTTARKRIVDIWIKHGTRMALRLFFPRAGRKLRNNPYAEFYKTYEGFETEESLRALIQRSGFANLGIKYLGFGAYMLTAVKGEAC